MSTLNTENIEILTQILKTMGNTHRPTEEFDVNLSDIRDFAFIFGYQPDKIIDTLMQLIHRDDTNIMYIEDLEPDKLCHGIAVHHCCPMVVKEWTVKQLDTIIDELQQCNEIQTA